jgi:homoserine O-acetyltransferase/O-succinyltransferase
MDRAHRIAFRMKVSGRAVSAAHRRPRRQPASRDYDPAPQVEGIRAPLLAINSADDLINPPELGILERGIKRVANGRAVLIPLGPDTRGHGTHTIAAVWEHYLGELLAALAR